MVQVYCEVPYAHENTARHLLAQLDGELVEVHHGNRVLLTLQLPAAGATELRQQLLDATRGELVWRSDQQE